MSIIDIPGSLFPVSAAPVCDTDGAVTLDAISVKDVQMVYLYVHLYQAVGHATAITPLCGTAVASTAVALPENVEIWYGLTTTSTVAMAKQSDAKLFTVDVGAVGQIHLIFKIDPAILQATGTAYDCLGGTIASSAQATNLVSAVWLIQPRHANAPASNVATRFIAD